MIEMLGVLAIIGVLSVGGIAGYSKAMMKYRVNKKIEQITLIAGNIRSFFGPQKNYKGVDSSLVQKKAKLVPEEMRDGSSIIDPFGAHVNLYSTSSKSSGDSKGFYIYQNPILEEECINLITYNWEGANVALLAIFLDDPAGMYYFNPPVAIDDAIEYCRDIDDDVVDIYFYFDIDVNSAYWQEIINQ